MKIGADPDLQRFLRTGSGRLHGGDPGTSPQKGQDAGGGYDFFQCMITHRFHHFIGYFASLYKNASK